MVGIADVLSGQARWCVVQGDCLDALRSMPDCCADSLVTDPPSGIGFMGREWDSNKGGRDNWIAWLTTRLREAYRVLKPGAHIVIWSLPRTSHWTGMAIENAGFEIRETIDHLFGSGFPKSLNVSQEIDDNDLRQWCIDQGWAWELVQKAKTRWRNAPKSTASRLNSRLKQWLCWRSGLVRQVVHSYSAGGNAGAPTAVKGGTYGAGTENSAPVELTITKGATEKSRKWDGWGTGLKPAKEVWWIARKPVEGTIVANVLTHGCGALNIDGCRVPTDWDEPDRPESWRNSGHTADSEAEKIAAPPGDGIQCHPLGRFPANVVLSHSADCGDECAEDCPVRRLGEQSGESCGTGEIIGGKPRTDSWVLGGTPDRSQARMQVGDSGTAARYFNTFNWDPELDDPFCYVPKPTTAERDAGCYHLPLKSAGECTGDREEGAPGTVNARAGAGGSSVGRHNHHPTLKSVELMRHLVRLVTPPGGLVLSLFAGSGTDGIAAHLEGMRFIGCELDAEFCEIARCRIAYWAARAHSGKPKAPAKKKGDRQIGLFG
jgi:hypothetical protein